MLQLRAWLVDSEPEIWRRLVVDPRLTLEQLHTVLQHAFGWTDSHLHQFEAEDGTRYALPSPMDADFGEPAINERKVTLGEVFDQENTTIAYEYDFGDSWIHGVCLEKRIESEPPPDAPAQGGKRGGSAKPRAAICIEGERNGPPEDCGGVFGMYDLMQVKRLAPDARSEDDEDLLEWLGDWDEERFDLVEINRALAKTRVKKAFAGR